MRVELSPISFWFHDLCSCLHDCIGTVLLYYNQDPILTMGAAWEFYHQPNDVTREEFYYPSPRPTLAESMMPFHPIASTWHRSDDGEAALADLKAVLARGEPAIIAEDNFYIPFRPAFGDVHAAHLLVMYGFDEATDDVFVLDSTPPIYKGPIKVSDFLAARSSDNRIEGERDFFFAGAPIANRWLQLEVNTPFPELTREWVAEVIATNVRRFREPGAGPGMAGMAGLAAYLHGVCERALGPEGGRALDEMYTVSWVAQAAAGLHADFLMEAGRRLNWYELAEIGRHVALVANSWTGLRMLGSHSFSEGLNVVDQVALRTAQLLLEQEKTLDLLERAIRLRS
ncbi:MAG TPA: BtrH N-terminal domain-containing protein [Herpetosiphonaceae bacterium]